MGRLRKYKTEEERRAANNEKVKRFYWAHKEECDRKSRERYKRKKLKYQPKDGELAPVEQLEQVMISMPNEQ